MTPLEIEILLHYYGHSDDYRQGDFSAPAVRDAIDRFKGHMELLEPEGQLGQVHHMYRLTERGKVYVEALMVIPLPVKAWKMP